MANNVLQAKDIDDLVAETQDYLVKKGAFVNMQTDTSKHVAVSQMWKKKQHKFVGGKRWRLDYQMDHNHSAHTTGLFATDTLAINDTMKTGYVEARHITANYGYDVKEPVFQQGGHAIVDLLKTRYCGMMVSYYELMERILWGKPIDENDDETPFGIAYWVTRSAEEGFHGGNPVGFSQGRAGIDTTKYPRYANYTGAYSQIKDEDLVAMMCRCARKTNFVSPVSHEVPEFAKTGNGIYTNDSVLSELEQLLRDHNMSLGVDIAKMHDRCTFKSTPFTYAPKLDEDSTDPIYMLDWNNLGIGVLPGWADNLSAPRIVSGKSKVRAVDLDTSMNMACIDPRTQAVFYRKA